MKLTLWQRINGRVDAVSKGQYSAKCREVTRLKSRIDALDPALFECRKILRCFTSYYVDQKYRREESRRILAKIRIQIPADEMPTEGYPKEAD